MIWWREVKVMTMMFTVSGILYVKSRHSLEANTYCNLPPDSIFNEAGKLVEPVKVRLIVKDDSH